MSRRNCVSLVLALPVLFAVACTDVTTPSEPAAFVAPTPAPTVAAGQPASLAGSVRSYGPLEPGATVECQGKSTTAAGDGTFTLPGLFSGSTKVTVAYSHRTSSGALYSDYENFAVLLQPGANTENFFIY